MSMEFKKGQKVRIKVSNAPYYNEIGIIQQISPQDKYPIYVTLNNRGGLFSFKNYEIEPAL